MFSVSGKHSSGHLRHRERIQSGSHRNDANLHQRSVRFHCEKLLKCGEHRRAAQVSRHNRRLLPPGLAFHATLPLRIHRQSRFQSDHDSRRYYS